MASPAVPHVRRVAAGCGPQDPRARSFAEVADQHRAPPECVGPQTERTVFVEGGDEEAAAVRRSAEHPSRRHVVLIPVPVVLEGCEIRVELLPRGPLHEPAADERGGFGDLAAHDVPVQAPADIDAVVATAARWVARGRRRRWCRRREDTNAPAGRDRDGLVRAEHVERHPTPPYPPTPRDTAPAACV